MSEFIFIPLMLCSAIFGLTASKTTFDQRQTGELNVQIGLKNINLIALLKGGKEEYVDYDYVYDYSEMTIKPHNVTTPKPLNVTNSQTLSYVTTSLPTILPGNNTMADIYIPSVNSSMYQINVSLGNDTEHIYDTDVNSHTTELIKTTPELLNNTSSLLNIVGSNGTTITKDETNQSVNAEFFNTVASTTVKIAPEDPTTTLPESVNTMTITQAINTSHCRRGFVRSNQGKCEYKVHGTTNALRRIVKLAQKIKIGRGFMKTENSS